MGAVLLMQPFKLAYRNGKGRVRILIGRDVVQALLRTYWSWKIRVIDIQDNVQVVLSMLAHRGRFKSRYPQFRSQFW